METKNNLVHVFARSEKTVYFLKYKFEKEGIPTKVINEYEQSNNFTGFKPQILKPFY